MTETKLVPMGDCAMLTVILVDAVPVERPLAYAGAAMLVPQSRVTVSICVLSVVPPPSVTTIVAFPEAFAIPDPVRPRVAPAGLICAEQFWMTALGNIPANVKLISVPFADTPTPLSK
jgi:hypothetical protein